MKDFDPCPECKIGTLKKTKNPSKLGFALGREANILQCTSCKRFVVPANQYYYASHHRDYGYEIKNAPKPLNLIFSRK